MNEPCLGSNACTRRLPDYTGVQIVEVAEGGPADLHAAMQLAVTIAQERLEEHMLLSWYDRDRGIESPRHAKECARPGAVPGYVDYGLSRGARLKVDIGAGRFVFFFLPVADTMA